MTWDWLAGFFDGEGTIFISLPTKCKKSAYHYLIVAIVQKDRAVLDRIKNFVGFGTVYIQNKAGDNEHTPHNIYRYSSFGSNARKILENILPYTQCKKMQTQYALQFLNNKTFKKNVTNKEFRWREMHRQLIRLYNG